MRGPERLFSPPKIVFCLNACTVQSCDPLNFFSQGLFSVRFSPFCRGWRDHPSPVWVHPGANWYKTWYIEVGAGIRNLRSTAEKRISDLDSKKSSDKSTSFELPHSKVNRDDKEIWILVCTVLSFWASKTVQGQAPKVDWFQKVRRCHVPVVPCWSHARTRGLIPTLRFPD